MVREGERSFCRRCKHKLIARVAVGGGNNRFLFTCEECVAVYVSNAGSWANHYRYGCYFEEDGSKILGSELRYLRNQRGSCNVPLHEPVEPLAALVMEASSDNPM